MKVYQALLVTIVILFGATPLFACDPPCYTTRCITPIYVVRPACPPPVVYYPRPAYTLTQVSTNVSVSTRTYYGYGGYSTSTHVSVSTSVTTIRR